MKYQQRVGLFAHMEYELTDSVQLSVTYRSIAKNFKRAIDLRFLNPSPIEEKLLSVKTGILTVVFLVLGCVWGSYGIAGAPTMVGKIGSTALGVVACGIALHLATLTYLRSRPLVGFINVVTNRAEVIVYLSYSRRDEAIQFIGELRSKIAQQQYESSQRHVDVDGYAFPRKTGTHN